MASDTKIKKRNLSIFQSRDWMIKISRNRKYKNPPRGEKNGNAVHTQKQIDWIRQLPADARIMACKKLNISERHWYHIRAFQRWEK